MADKYPKHRHHSGCHRSLREGANKNMNWFDYIEDSYDEDDEDDEDDKTDLSKYEIYIGPPGILSTLNQFDEEDED